MFPREGFCLACRLWYYATALFSAVFSGIGVSFLAVGHVAIVRLLLCAFLFLADLCWGEHSELHTGVGIPPERKHTCMGIPPERTHTGVGIPPERMNCVGFPPERKHSRGLSTYPFSLCIRASSQLILTSFIWDSHLRHFRFSCSF